MTIKRKSYVDYEHEKVNSLLDKTFTPIEEARICLECPLPKCTIKAGGCKRFTQERRKLKKND